MALVLGTNAGFVTVAPTANPNGTSSSGIDDESNALKDTSPSDSIKVTEIGWFCQDATEAANFEVGIYTDDTGNDRPEDLLAGASITNAKGTTAGWKVVTGLDITISADTLYWIGVQLDDTATRTDTEIETTGGTAIATKNTQTELPSNWGTSSSGFVGRLSAFYAKVEVSSVSATDNMTIIGENIY